jgi:hypothetical protein
MVTAIKDTPVLTGKDARRFEKKMRIAEKNPIKSIKNATPCFCKR